jgi:hypothetical protein
MADNLVTIAEYMDSMQAEMARQVLEDFGIRAVVMDQNAANLCLPSTLLMTAKLQVLESDAARATEILESAATTDETSEFDEFDESDEPDEQLEK